VPRRGKSAAGAAAARLARNHRFPPGAGALFCAFLGLRAAAADGGGALALDPGPGGPFPLRPLHPLSLPFYYPLPDRAATSPAGKLTIEASSQYASVQNAEIDTRAAAVFDGELHRLALALRYGLLDGFEVRCEIPILLRSGGFLDATIEDFHDVTGLVFDDRRDGRFDQRLEVDGRELIDERSQGYRLGDIPIEVKKRVLDSASWPVGLSVRAAIELPTGESADWLGNRRLDGGLGALLEKAWGPLAVHANVDYRLISAPRRLRSADVDMRSAVAGMAALRWRFHPRWAAIVQVNASQSVFRDDFDLDTLRNPQVELLAGVNGLLWNGLEGYLGVTEDLVPDASADFVVFFGLAFGLDPAAPRGRTEDGNAHGKD
jgi:hypothetical protein